MNVFPETAAGGWQRASLRDVPVSEAPDPVPRTAVERLQQSVYRGPAETELEARAYRLSSPGVGLDLVQRWRPSADTVFFNRGNYFVVVKWQKADRQALREFVRDLSSRLKEK